MPTSYVLIKDGEMEVIPLDVDVRAFTHISIRGKHISRNKLMRFLHFYSVRGNETAVFMLSKAEFDAL